jgi:hypothetical protein
VCRLHALADRTAELNGIDPQAWLADVIARIFDLPVSRLTELLPWNGKPQASRGSQGGKTAVSTEE